MTTFEFILKLDIEQFSDEEIERLYEAGCDDGLPGSVGGVAEILFGREAESFGEAVSSAMRDVGRSGVAAAIVSIVPLDAAHQTDADDFNRALSLLDRFHRADVQAWPVGHA
ncbi:MAG: hypothetical protein WD066_09965 [Planctomycetaceae bacterium]